VARELLNTARRVRADVIVMGTHGRGRVRAFLLGSHAQEVVRQAPCPILLVRYTGTRRRMTRSHSRSRSPGR
jgi:nucleotide-binding universal stress UspA family protein